MFTGQKKKMIDGYSVQLLLSYGQETLFVKSKAAIILLEALGSPFCRQRWGGVWKDTKHAQTKYELI